MAGKGKQTQNLRNVQRNGPFGGKLAERIAVYYGSDGEKIYAGENNTWIILGRDRNGSIFSDKSYGTQGASESGAIDIVVGRKTSLPTKIRDANTGKDSFTYNNPNFETDAARIYISQKADIDSYISLTKTSKAKALSDEKYTSLKDTPTSAGKSAVALISDHTRIVGREGVKLISQYYQKNSRDGYLDLGGIDIIAHNRVDDTDHQLHPMVRGDNLKIALTKIIDYIESVAGTLSTFLAFQMNFNKLVVDHKHYQGSPIFNPITDSSYILGVNGISEQINLLTVTQQELIRMPGQWKANIYTQYLADTGENYINSLWNKVN
jgi:hypothetical protein